MLSKKSILNNSANKDCKQSLTEVQRDLLKRTLCEMIEEIDGVCRKHGIKMFLAGGSLLGAVRHKGFIPWDDDADFGMTREDYKRFVSIFDAELGDRYDLRCPNSPYPYENRFMQVFKKGTVLETVGGNTPLRPSAVFLDIFPYDAVPDSIVLRTAKGIWCNGLMAIASSVTEYKHPNDEVNRMMMQSMSGRILHSLTLAVGLLFSWKSPIDWFAIVDNAIQHNGPSHYITSATGRKHYLGETFSKDVFLPLQEISFENLRLYAPAHPEVYLRHNYGEDYMSIPPVSKRESHFVKRLEL